MIKSFCVSCIIVFSSISIAHAQHTVTMASGEIMVGEVRALKDGMVQFFFKGNEMNISTSKISTISFVDDMGGNVEQTSSTKGVTYVMPGRKMIKDPKIDNLTMEKGVNINFGRNVLPPQIGP